MQTVNIVYNRRFYVKYLYTFYTIVYNSYQPCSLIQLGGVSLSTPEREEEWRNFQGTQVNECFTLFCLYDSTLEPSAQKFMRIRNWLERA